MACRGTVAPRFVHEARDWHDFADAVARVLENPQCPFDAPAVAMIREELSASQVYQALDERFRRFFAGPGAGPGRPS